MTMIAVVADKFGGFGFFKENHDGTPDIEIVDSGVIGGSLGDEPPSVCRVHGNLIGYMAR